MKKDKKISQFLIKKGIRAEVLESQISIQKLPVQNNQITQLKEGLMNLKEIHPPAMHAFCVHFRFVSGVLLENISEKEIGIFLETLMRYAKAYGVSIEKDETLPVGWCVSMETSPIKTLSGKNCIGLIDATMTQAVLASLVSIFQQMEPELLNAS